MKVYCTFQLNLHPWTQALLWKNWSLLFIILWIFHQAQNWVMLVFSHFLLVPWHQKFTFACF